MTIEQAELIEKLNCLEFETSQLKHAYQQWRSQIEQGPAPDWMAAVIRVTYDALITFCIDTVSAVPPDTSQTDEIECYGHNDEPAPPLGSALLAEDSMTPVCLRHRQRLQCDDAEDEVAETDLPVGLTVLIDRSRVLAPARQQNGIVGVLALSDLPRAFSAKHLNQLEAACEIPGILAEESATAEQSPQLLPITEPEPDWFEPEMPVAVSPPSIAGAISEPQAIQQGQQQEESRAELASIHRLATLRLPNWLQAISAGRLFGAASLAVLAFVAILMVAGGAIGIYAVSHRATQKSDVPLAAVDAGTIPAGEKTEFKFDPDAVVAPLGSSFVLNTVLSRGSDVASVAVQIDYDANLLQFIGVSQGGFLTKAGRQVLLVQHNDPLSGVLKINAEQSPGIPGITGDGPVFALSFQAMKRGKATVSIVPGAHDSQGRRIEMAGSQVSVTVH